MTSSPQEMKKQTIDWLDKYPHLNHKELSENEKNPNNEFAYVIGDKPPKITVYARKAIPDRLFIQADSRFGPQHKKLIDEMNKTDLSKLLLELTDRTLSYGIFSSVVLKDNKVIGFRIHDHIQYDAIDEHKFVHAVEWIQAVQVQVLNYINVKLGILSVPTTTESDNQSSMYS